MGLFHHSSFSVLAGLIFDNSMDLKPKRKARIRKANSPAIANGRTPKEILNEKSANHWFNK